TPLAGVVTQVGQAVANGGSTLGTALSTGPVQQLTQQLSTAIIPITSQLTGATQTLGATSGLGSPGNTLLGQLGGAV
ncbi:collagen-like triple helix repeat-containing protein, partial [Klebsiella pneumoniae]|nr:collagen-like triple helix repeat-containing protein [Klebsiella pneumoniae]